jgi:hypothetical protein
MPAQLVDATPFAIEFFPKDGVFDSKATARISVTHKSDVWRRCRNPIRADCAAANVGACGKEFQVFLEIESGQAVLLAEGLIEFTVLRQTLIEVSFPAGLP